MTEDQISDLRAARKLIAHQIEAFKEALKSKQLKPSEQVVLVTERVHYKLGADFVLRCDCGQSVQLDRIYNQMWLLRIATALSHLTNPRHLEEVRRLQM